MAETPSNQQMMDIKSIIPQIDYTNKYVSVAARQSLPGASRSQLSYTNLKDHAESRSMVSELPEDVTAGRAQLQQQEQQLLLQQQQQQLKLQRQQQQQQQEEEQKEELCAPVPKLNTVSPIFSNDAGGEDAQRLNRALLQHLQSRGDVYESE